jgi:hypothetical protein
MMGVEAVAAEVVRAPVMCESLARLAAVEVRDQALAAAEAQRAGLQSSTVSEVERAL